MVELEPVTDPQDVAELLRLIQLHHQSTDSPVAHAILANWPTAVAQFVKVMPIEYKRVPGGQRETTRASRGAAPWERSIHFMH